LRFWRSGSTGNEPKGLRPKVEGRGRNEKQRPSPAVAKAMADKTAGKPQLSRRERGCKIGMTKLARCSPDGSGRRRVRMTIQW
jgi:hypothetical protein